MNRSILALAIAFSPALSIISAAPSAKAASIDRLEVSVNSSIILTSDLRKFRDILQLRAQLDPLFSTSPIAAKGPNASNEEIARFLADDAIILQSFPISDNEVEQEINSVQANNKIDRATLRRALTEQGFRFEDYFELIRLSVSKRMLIDREIRQKVTVSDDDVKNYFYNHYARTAAVPSAFHIQIISTALSNYKSVEAAREVSERAQKALQQGETFDEVAKRMSDDPSASTGGDLGILPDDQMAPFISEQVKKMNPGQISAIFGGKKAGGFYIVRLIDVRSSDTERLEKMKEEIRTQLSSGEYGRQISLWLERQRQIAFMHRAGEAPALGSKN